jgi:hypothetical protein
MPDYRTSFEEIASTLDDFVVPAPVLARWAAMAGQLAAVRCVPTQSNAA